MVVACTGTAACIALAIGAGIVGATGTSVAIDHRTSNSPQVPAGYLADAIISVSLNAVCGITAGGGCVLWAIIPRRHPSLSPNQLRLIAADLAILTQDLQMLLEIEVFADN